MIDKILELFYVFLFAMSFMMIPLSYKITKTYPKDHHIYMIGVYCLIFCVLLCVVSLYSILFK